MWLQSLTIASIETPYWPDIQVKLVPGAAAGVPASIALLLPLNSCIAGMHNPNGRNTFFGPVLIHTVNDAEGTTSLSGVHVRLQLLKWNATVA